MSERLKDTGDVIELGRFEYITTKELSTVDDEANVMQPVYPEYNNLNDIDWEMCGTGCLHAVQYWIWKRPLS